MRINIQETENNSMVIVTLEGKKPFFPTTPIRFDDADIARTAGFYIGEGILRSNVVEYFQAGQFEGVDMLAITIKPGNKWGDLNTAGSNISAMQKHLTETYITRGRLVYQSPEEADVPTQEQINDFISEKEREPGSVFHKSLGDGGSIAAQIDPNARKLFISFRGACDSKCKDGSNVPSKRRAGNAFKDKWAGLETVFLS